MELNKQTPDGMSTAVEKMGEYLFRAYRNWMKEVVKVIQPNKPFKKLECRLNWLVFKLLLEMRSMSTHEVHFCFYDEYVRAKLESMYERCTEVAKDAGQVHVNTMEENMRDHFEENDIDGGFGNTSLTEQEEKEALTWHFACICEYLVENIVAGYTFAELLMDDTGFSSDDVLLTRLTQMRIGEGDERIAAVHAAAKEKNFTVLADVIDSVTLDWTAFE